MVNLRLDLLGDRQRTHYCGELGVEQAGQTVFLAGWVDVRRDLGNIIFLDVRDHTGVTQVVCNPEISAEAHDRADEVRPEYVVGVEGEVVLRAAETINPQLPTGRVEVKAKRLLVLNEAKTPPFPIEDETRTSEETRLRYRYTYAEFVQIMRAGVDLDQLHPTCSSGNINAGCVPPPFNGNLLQIMPWPDFKDMNDLDLQAIYAYLSAIPCVAGPPAPDPLHNDCGTPPPPNGGSPITITVTGPGGATSASNTFVTNYNQIALDASQSKSSNAGALAYSWTASPAFRGAILSGNTATPMFQLPSRGTYQFTLTVTDATGVTATATITVQYS